MLFRLKTLLLSQSHIRFSSWNPSSPVQERIRPKFVHPLPLPLFDPSKPFIICVAHRTIKPSWLEPVNRDQTYLLAKNGLKVKCKLVTTKCHGGLNIEKPSLLQSPWPFFHSGIHDRAASIWILKMKKLVQDLVQHLYGRLCKFNRERKTKIFMLSP